MDQLERKTFTTSRSLTFTYYQTRISSNSRSKAPTLLLLHGFPDDAHLWKAIVPSLLKAQYALLIPDLLGYSGTSKPLDPSLYSYDAHTKDLSEILDAEGIDTVIAVGHDWGSAVAQRVYLFHPERVVGLALLNVSYMPPTYQPFDLAQTMEMTEKVFGHPLFAYWELLTAEDGPKIMRDNVGKLYEVLHGDEEDWMKKMFCVRGAMREYLLGDKSVPLKAYAQEAQMKKDFVERMTRDGFEAPVNYYKAHLQNFHYEAEKAIPKERVVLNLPVLFIGCTGDAVCRVDSIERVKQAGLVPDLEVKVIESGHWSPFEKPQEIADALVSFLEKRFPVST